MALQTTKLIGICPASTLRGGSARSLRIKGTSGASGRRRGHGGCLRLGASLIPCPLGDIPNRDTPAVHWQSRKGQWKAQTRFRRFWASRSISEAAFVPHIIVSVWVGLASLVAWPLQPARLSPLLPLCRPRYSFWCASHPIRPCP